MNNLSELITKEFRFFSRVLFIVLSFSAGIDTKAEVDMIEYYEDRIDVSDYAGDYILDALCTNIDGQNKKIGTIDLGNIPNGRELRYVHKLYGDTLHERYEGKTVQKIACEGSFLMQKGFYSRLSDVSFDKGLILENFSNELTLPYRYPDLLTIENSDGTKSIYNIETTFNEEDFCPVILAPGDTINNLKRYITEFESRVVNQEDASSNSGVSLIYKNIRLVTPDRAFPVVEICIIATPNNRTCSMTIFRGKPEKAKSPKSIGDSLPDQLKSIVISDISGKIVYRSKTDTPEISQNIDLQAGWYIVTQYFNSKTISEKKFFSTSVNLFP